jgi:A-macroglobulin TED domain/Alpha-2-macroglobulin family/Carboxypeptidase regulatory-like domain/A-macroglobulin receptor binding domain/MG2 domain/Alpha-2-macroglobulin bait region domain
MANRKLQGSAVRFAIPLLVGLVSATTIFSLRASDDGGPDPSLIATYAHGLLHVTIPYRGADTGAGQLTLEVLDPEDDVLGRTERHLEVNGSSGRWKEEIRLEKPLPLEDLVWYRLRYRFEYDDKKIAARQGTESLSQILRRPVIHILGQQSYFAGGQAAVRVIVTDSEDQPIAGRGSVQIELLEPDAKPQLLFQGGLNRRGTTEAQFRLPTGLIGSYQLHYVADTAIGTTEFSQSVRLEDKVSILLTTEKPIYQPGQTIHVRALALNRADHEAAGQRDLTFEVEDSRGNKVFKKVTETDEYGVASAAFVLADEVNLGAYHLRALIGNADAPTNTAEIAINVELYVLPKFKVAVELGKEGRKQKHGYQPGDHVIGTVRANYFFGKPVDHSEVNLKASAIDVTLFEAASAHGKTDADGVYHFDLRLPDYFAGRPLSHGAARVLIEATVRDSSGHAETRGEPITVSDSPILLTAIPEGGTLVPHLENQVFILASYPDGSPAKSNITVRYASNADQVTSTDDAGVAIVNVRPDESKQALEIDATDQEGNRASSKVALDARDGDEQILLRTERAVYRAGEVIRLNVYSTKVHGAVYVDIVKDGQTVLTRDLDVENGRAELAVPATSEMSGTLDLSAYLFARDGRPISDHRLIFVQPADELKIETVADSKSYKPGSDARIQFRVTNSHGQGVHAALGLQVVDEAVFALSEKQPGFAKVFFYLEQEVMKPRYEIHSIGMSAVVEPAEQSRVEPRDRAARALFSATEIAASNKFETEIGKDLPMTKYGEYHRRYQARFQEQANDLAKKISNAYVQNPKAGSPTQIYQQLARAGGAEFLDPWGQALRFEPASSNKNYYRVISAGPDQRPNTGDELQAILLFQRKRIASIESPAATALNINVEHDRGAMNGQAQIVGTVTDPSGAVVPGAKVEVRARKSLLTAITDATGQFSLSAVSPGDYRIQISTAGFRMAAGTCSLSARDRAVISATLSVGQSTTTVEVSEEAPMLETESAMVVAPAPMARGAATGGAVAEVITMQDAQSVAINGRNFTQLATRNSGVVAKDASAAPTARVRSYFPEALYINPEIITDREGRASIVIPMADSITTWRMTMIASTQHGALGTATSSLKVFQDFFVDLDLPVTLTQGDRVSIPVAIYNYSGTPGDVALQLQSDDWFSLVDDAPDKSVSVESSRVGAAQFTLEARRIGKFKLTLSARMKGASERADIVVREVEVIPNGREQNLVFNGNLENSMQHELNFPQTSIAGASKIFVRLYPGPMSQVVEGMDSILRMPNGCFEQTSSSTYPNVLALDYMKRTKKLTAEIHAKAEGYIANGYQRLLTFEVPGGGFSWFGNVPANKILTAYGLMEFYDMSKVYDVDPRLIERTQQWLAGDQQKDGSWKPDTQFINEGATNRYNTDLLRITAYIAWSLKNTTYQGEAVERAKRFVETHMGEKADTYTLAVIANFAASYAADREFTRHAIQLLLDARTEKDEKVWWTAEETGVYGSGESASVETTGLAVQALLQSGEGAGTARKALNYIASKKDANGTWGTTQATIMALRALLTATDKAAAGVQGTVTVLVNGKPAEKLELTAENNDLLHQFVFKDVEQQGPSTVELRFDGKGALAYQLVGQYFLPWDEKPAPEPLSIEVAYDRTRLAQDDLATATATIKNNLSKTAKMVMVDLGIPPGFDLLSEDLQDYQANSAKLNSGHLSKFSLTATQAILYFDAFAAGDTVKVKFRLRAKYPIRVRTFQSRVYEYYDPEVASVARPVQLEVRRYTSVQKHDGRLDRLLSLPNREIRPLITQGGNMTWKLLTIRAACIRLGLIPKYN